MKKQKYTEKQIVKCMEYANKLLDNNVPVIFDLQHLSLLIGIEKKLLASIIFTNKEKLYKVLNIPKKSGGYRELTIPISTLKYIQKWILKNILIRVPASNYATGFENKTSIVKNAKKHLNQYCIINLDLKNFFPSISEKRIFGIFYKLGYSKEVSYILTQLCTYKNTLPQGAPTSPKLSNLCCINLDKRIGGLSKKYNANYSRYADDITISGNKYIRNILQYVKNIIIEEGFTLNERKTRILSKSQRQEVTGLNLNSGKVTVPKSYKRQLQQEIYYCKKYGVANHLAYINCDKAFYKEHLYGKAYFVYMVEPVRGKQFLEQLNEINWSY